jgi:AMMECR1 domain-containing protein
VKSKSLAQAIREAASKDDLRVAPISADELPQLRCSVGVIHSLKPFNVANWQQGIHGLYLRRANPSYNPDQDGSRRTLKAIQLKEHAIAGGWPYMEALVDVMEAAGYCDDESWRSAETIKAIILREIFCFKTVSATASLAALHDPYFRHDSSGFNLK